MSSTTSGRHRAPSRLSVKPMARNSAILIASGGLVASMSGGAQAAPAPAQPTVLPAAPNQLPAALSALSAAPAALPSAPVALPAARGWTTVRWGSSGGVVKSVQRIVGAYPDGVFGPKTHRAVQRWQSRQGLVADGIVGPITARAMGLNASSRGSSSASRSSSRSAPSTSSSAVLSYAQQYTGYRFVYGGSSTSGFDCSGYTSYVFRKAGISLPRTAEQQRRATTRVSNPRPGDLVFWGAPAWHVGIYAGNGMVYDAGRSTARTQKRTIFPGVTSYGRVG